MTDEQDHPRQPRPPEGFQRPGIPGAGNILDPQVRADLRERIHPAVHDAAAQLKGEAADRREDVASTPASPAPAADAPPPSGTRAGPFPHGDVDLSSLQANVPPEPVRLNRLRVRRRFYFLQDAPAPAQEVPPGNPAQAGPQPG